MSEDRRSPPPDWRHGGPLPEEPPHLRVRKVRDDPEVQGLLKELSEGLKPGENMLVKTMAQAMEKAGLNADRVGKIWKAWVQSPR